MEHDAACALRLVIATVSALHLAEPVWATDKVTVAQVTYQCAQYSPVRVNTAGQWYEIRNGCREPIFVQVDNEGKGRYSHRMELGSGQSAESWVSPSVRDVRFIACPVNFDGRKVLYDPAKGCYVPRQWP